MRLTCLIFASLFAFYLPASQPLAPLAEPTVQSSVRQIDVATDPAAVIDAYSAGVAIDPNDVELLDAYVQKMIHLELPNQAAPAAEKLLTLQPNNPVARIVVADAQARRGEMIDAMTNLAIAGPKLSDDTFAQQTAGRLFAWYDNAIAGADPKPTLPVSVQPALDQIRHDWQDLRIYRQAYDEATDAYKRQASTDQASSDSAIPQPLTYETQESLPAYQPTYQPYYEPSVIYAPTYYEPDYYYPYGTYFGSRFFFVNRHNDRDHRGFDHHDGHWDGRGDGRGNDKGPFKVGDARFVGPVHPADRDGHRESGSARPAAARPAAPAARPAPAPSKPAPAARSGGSSSGSGGRSGGGHK